MYGTGGRRDYTFDTARALPAFSTAAARLLHVY